MGVCLQSLNEHVSRLRALVAVRDVLDVVEGLVDVADLGVDVVGVADGRHRWCCWGRGRRRCGGSIGGGRRRDCAPGGDQLEYFFSGEAGARGCCKLLGESV